MANNPSQPPGTGDPWNNEDAELEDDDDSSSNTIVAEDENAEMNEFVNKAERESVILLKEALDLSALNDRFDQVSLTESVSPDKLSSGGNSTIITDISRPLTSPLPAMPPLINKAYLMNADVIIGPNLPGVILTEPPIMRDLLQKDEKDAKKSLNDKSNTSDESENKSEHSDQSEKSNSDSVLSNASDVKTVITAPPSGQKSLISTHSSNKSTLSHKNEKIAENEKTAENEKSDNKSLQVSNKSEKVAEKPEVNKNDLDEHDERRPGEDNVPKPIVIEESHVASVPPPQVPSTTISPPAASIAPALHPRNRNLNARHRRRDGKKSFNEMIRKIFKKKKPEVVNQGGN